MYPKHPNKWTNHEWQLRKGWENFDENWIGDNRTIQNAKGKKLLDVWHWENNAFFC